MFVIVKPKNSIPIYCDEKVFESPFDEIYYEVIKTKNNDYFYNSRCGETYNLVLVTPYHC